MKIGLCTIGVWLSKSTNIKHNSFPSLLLFSFSETLSATLFALSATDLVIFEFVAYLDSLCGLNYLVV